MKTKPVIHAENAHLLRRTSKLTHRKKLPWGLLIKLVCATTILLPAIDTYAGAIVTTLFAFTNETDGVYTDSQIPQASLVFGSDGNLYGTTSGGGLRPGFPPDLPSGLGYAYGTVFQISTTGEMTNLFAFNSAVVFSPYIAPDGAVPSGGLVPGNGGYFYGSTTFGGTNVPFSFFGGGTVFRIGPDGTPAVLHLFTGTNDGTEPIGGLALGKDGFLYGATSLGTNRSRWGTLFKVDTNGVFTTLHQFTNGTDGVFPLSAPVQGTDGNFYGTSWAGGSTGAGTIFKITADGTFSTLYNFTGTNDGANSLASLIQGSDGSFYGTTSSGGANNQGAVFKFDTNGTFTRLYSFTGANADSTPCAPLVQGSDGYLYGTPYGSLTGIRPGDLAGSIFQISTNGAYSNLYSFTGGDDGWQPVGGLVQGPDGSFYGTTADGGQYGSGTVFRLTVMPTARAAAQADGVLNLTWSAEKGGTYQLQWTSDLSSGNWVNRGSTLTATGPTVSVSDSTTNSPQRFYRLMPVLN